MEIKTADNNFSHIFPLNLVSLKEFHSRTVVMYPTEMRLVTVFCLLLSINVYSQAVLSPALLIRESDADLTKTILSISVRQSNVFEHTYKNDIDIHAHLVAVNCFLVTLHHPDVLVHMQSDPNIVFIDLHRQAKPEAVLDFVNPAYNRITRARTAFPTLRGATRNASIKELNFDPANIDIVNRSFTTTVTPMAVEQHATNMAILVGGGGNSSYRALGVAPAVRFTASDFNNLFPDNAALFTGNDIYLQNHSYGVGVEKYYGNEAFAYDQQVSQLATMVHVFSTGNMGTFQSANGPYPNLTYGNLTGTFKQAKNVLVVTAVDSMLGVNTLNSRGPAYDGRVKPELTAYGQGGTSDAAAIVSGIVTLVQEKFDVMQGVLPDASMVKSILIATADDVGPAGIDFTYGYGSVNAYKALQLISDGQWATTNLTANDEVTIPINIPAAVAQIKIAVSWTDPAATPNAPVALVHDIDSQLEFGGNTYLPWVLSHYPLVDSLTALPKRKADHLNNAEYITLDHPVPGTYTLRLTSGSLANGSQSVSLAYWMDGDALFSWDFPLASDVVEGGSSNLLVWEAQPGQTGDLHVQLNGGDWTLVAPALLLDDYFYWDAPDTLARAQLKMQIGTTEVLSEEFLISPLIKMRTAFICADSLGLSWSAVNGATGYKMYTMGTQYLTATALTSDTIQVLSTVSSPYFTVAPMYNGVEGLKSETINYTLQGANCFLNAFSVLRLSGTQIHVQVRLSSAYQVNQVTLYKTTNTMTRELATFTAQNQILFDYDDTELIPGTMMYQAEIRFTNGKTILSDIISVPIEKVGGAILYPNPVTDDSDLNILTDGESKTFIILNASGQKLYEGEIEGIESSVDIVNLPTGLYFYQLRTEGKVTDAGRFVKY